MTEYEPGDRVNWTIRPGQIGMKRCSGTIVDVELSKFGYDDIIHVDSDTSDQPAYVRPEDLR